MNSRCTAIARAHWTQQPGQLRLDQVLAVPDKYDDVADTVMQALAYVFDNLGPHDVLPDDKPCVIRSIDLGLQHLAACQLRAWSRTSWRVDAFELINVLDGLPPAEEPRIRDMLRDVPMKKGSAQSAALSQVNTNKVPISTATAILDAALSQDAALRRLFGDVHEVSVYVIEHQPMSKFSKSTLMSHLSYVLQKACLEYQRRVGGLAGTSLLPVLPYSAKRKLALLPSKLKAWGVPDFMAPEQRAFLEEIFLRKSPSRMRPEVLATRIDTFLRPKPKKSRFMKAAAKKAASGASYRSNKATSIVALIGMLLQLETPEARQAARAAQCIADSKKRAAGTAGLSDGGHAQRTRVETH